MSEVFSFRLSRNTPREFRAFEILTARLDEGFSIRQVIVEALLSLEKTGHSELPFELLQIIHEINARIEQLITVIGDTQPIIPHEQSVAPPGLSDAFISSIKKTSRPGFALES